MSRRLCLTCLTLTFVRPQNVVLFTLIVTCLALALHGVLMPYDTKLMDSLFTCSHWLGLLVAITMLIRDSQLFTTTSETAVSAVLIATSVTMLVLILTPVAPEFGRLVKVLCQTGRHVLKRSSRRSGGLVTFETVRNALKRSSSEPPQRSSQESNSGKSVEMVDLEDVNARTSSARNPMAELDEEEASEVAGAAAVVGARTASVGLERSRALSTRPLEGAASHGV